MDYMVRSREDGLDIDILAPGDHRAALIDTIEQCCEGTRDCPTDEIRNAQVLVDGEDRGDLRLTLTPRNGQPLDIVEVTRAVRWTIDQVAE